MPALSESQVTLIINGDDVDPVEITQLLGCEPSTAHAKGEVVPIGDTGRTRIARFGSWRLSGGVRVPADLDDHIAELLGKCTIDLDVWTGLTKRFDVQLFSSLYLRKTNEGCEVSPQSLKSLGDRGIELGLDIYALTDD